MRFGVCVCFCFFLYGFSFFVRFILLFHIKYIQEITTHHLNELSAFDYEFQQVLQSIPYLKQMQLKKHKSNQIIAFTQNKPKKLIKETKEKAQKNVVINEIIM